MGIYGEFGKMHPPDFVSIGERGLFGGSIGDGDTNSESSSETFPPPLQREQSDGGENTFGSER